MYMPIDSNALEESIEVVKRQDSSPFDSTNSNSTTNISNTSPGPINSSQQTSQTWTYVVVAVVVVVVISIALIFSYMRLRKLRMAGRSPKYLPTQFLKRKWDSWQPKSKYSHVDRRGSSDSGPTATRLQNTNETTETTDGVNRHTSVRSIITLPAYSMRPKDNEEIIGREGERGGIDTVLELPETAQEEEERRESEMESLYQIRQARRREIAEREERRRERREARDRNDWTRLEELRRESRARREQNSLTNLAQNSASNVNLTAEMLIAEHNARGRDGRVSEVSYAQVGQVRHNGTRVRSNSHESEQSGLLNSAAPMGTHTRNASEATLQSLGGLTEQRYRDRSNSAATTVSLAASSFETVTPPSELSRPLTSRTVTSNLTGDSISETSAEEVDIGTERLVSSNAPQPPEYDGHDWGDAPDYMSRANSTATTRTAHDSLSRAISAVSRADTLSIITPSITISLPSGPNTPVAPTPTQSQSGSSR